MQPKNQGIVILTFFDWAARVYCRIFSISPFYLLLSVVSSLVAQLAMVLSFFLPLKVIFLFGSDHVPPYFEGIAPEASLTDLIVILVFLSAVFYFLFLGANRYSEILSAKGASKVEEATSKLALFSNQNEIALRSYFRFGNVLAAIFFLAACLIVFSIFYFNLFVISIICIGMTALFISLMLRGRGRISLHASSSSGPFISKVYGVLFLIVFFVMVLDLVYISDVGVYVALVCLLLVRQLFQRMTTATLDAVLLVRQKEKVDAIFFSKNNFSEVQKDKSSVLDFCKSEYLPELYCQIAGTLGLNEVKVNDFLEDDIRIVQSSLVDILLVVFNVSGSWYLVKLFEERHDLLAMRESDLLYSVEDQIPALDLVKVSSIGGVKAHFYFIAEACNLDSVLKTELTFKQRRDLFRARTFGFSPPGELLSRYLRSHLTLPDRVESLSDILNLSIYRQYLGDWTGDELLRSASELLKKLPMHVTTNDITADSLLQVDDEVVCVHWERWSIEPLGFGLSLPELELKHLQGLLNVAGLPRLDPGLVRLCGLFAILEGQLANQKLITAKDTLALIVACTDRLRAQDEVVS